MCNICLSNTAKAIEVNETVNVEHGLAVSALSTDNLGYTLFSNDNKWGASDALGTSGGVVTYSLTGALDQVYPSYTSSFGFDQTLDWSAINYIDYAGLMRDAFDAWSAVSNITFLEVEDPGTSLFTTGDPDIRISLADFGFSSTYAFAHAPPGAGSYEYAYNGNIVFNQHAASWPGWGYWNDGLFTHVAVHEIGHAIGLLHNEASGNVMQATASRSAQFQALGDGDIRGAQALYGSVGSEEIKIQLAASEADRTITGYISGQLTVEGNALNNNIAIHNSSGFVTLLGGGGDDYLSGGGNADSLYGGADNDELIGNQGADRLFGEAGTDRLEGGEGADHLDGGTDSDTLLGGAGDDTLLGGSGNDTITAGTGNDRVEAGVGNDVVYGGTTAPETGSDGNDTILLGEGNDSYFSGGGTDSLNGGAGQDILDFTDSKDLVVDLAAGTATGVYNRDGTSGDVAFNHTLSGFEDIRGGAADDSLTGSTGADILWGRDGADRLYGGEGDDTLLGHANNDLLRGEAGDDLLSGGSGDDLLFGDAGQDDLSGEAGTDILHGGAGNDSFTDAAGFGSDLYLGGSGNDQLTKSVGPLGEAGFDVFYGGAGFDSVTINGHVSDFYSLKDGNSVSIIEKVGPQTSVLVTHEVESFTFYGLNTATGIYETQQFLLEDAGSFNSTHPDHLSSGALIFGPGDQIGNQYAQAAQSMFFEDLTGKAALDDVAIDLNALFYNPNAVQIERYEIRVLDPRTQQVVQSAIAPESVSDNGLYTLTDVGQNIVKDGLILSVTAVQQGLGGVEQKAEAQVFLATEDTAQDALPIPTQPPAPLVTIEEPGPLPFVPPPEPVVQIPQPIVAASTTAAPIAPPPPPPPPPPPAPAPPTSTPPPVFIPPGGDSGSAAPPPSQVDKAKQILEDKNLDASKVEKVLKFYDVTNTQFEIAGDTSVRESGQFSMLKKADGTWGMFDGVSFQEQSTASNQIQFGDFTYFLDDTTLKDNGFDPGSLRDFDGNALGAEADWSLAGIADVDGDGSQQYLMINATLGRWASVNGDLNMADHGAGGATRVVGIYIDPFVADGTVEQGGEFDSQTRFTNDLKNSNLYVLGNIDGDQNGYQDVFFRTVDGTAYLRAVMHQDGNIQYANYMDWSQLDSWMKTHGVEEAFYDDWVSL